MRSDLPARWQCRPLAECGKWLSGGTPAKSRPEYWGGDLPWVGPKDLHVRYVDDAEEHLTALGATNGTRLAPRNSVLIVVRSMSLEKRLQIALTRREVAFNQDVKAIVPAADINPRFLLYALWGHHDDLHKLVDEASHGTKRLRTELLARFPIPVPPPKEQRLISSALGALDDKIDSNGRLAGLLETTLATLFKARFMDFAGVDEFEESPVGRVPRGWSIGSLSSVLDVLAGGTPNTQIADYWDGGIPWISVKDTVPGPYVLQTERSVTKNGLCDRRLRLYPRDTVVITARGTVGNVALMGRPMTINQSCYAIRGREDVGQLYAYFLLRQAVSVLRARSHGSVFSTITRRTFDSVQVVHPPRAELESFERRARPSFALLRGLTLESHTLSGIRDALLPKLISGQIRVPDTTDPADVTEPALA